MRTKLPSSAIRLIACLLPIALLFVLLPVLAIAQSSTTKPISEKGLTDALKIGGLKESELIAAIKARGVDFQLTAQSEQSLRAAGATDGEIAAVRANYRGSGAAPVQPAPQPANPPVQAQPAASSPSSLSPGVYLKNGSGWAPLPVESVTWEGAGLMSGLRKATGGLLNEEITGTIAGSHSGTAVQAPVQFLLQLAPGTSVQSYLLVHLHGKHDNREFKSDLGGSKSSDGVAFQAAQAAGNSYQITFSAGSGDYAFILRSDIPSPKGTANPGKAFTFRIKD
jgi:hypothetical protein